MGVVRPLRRLLACREGATALEFAFALPVLLLLILGMFEVAMLMFISTSVEGGLREAARFGITDQVADEAERETAIRNIIERHALDFPGFSIASMTFSIYDSFNDVGQPEPWVDAEPLNGVYDAGEGYTDLNGDGSWSEDRGVAGVGQSGDVVRYRIVYDWELLTPYLAYLFGEDGVLHMSASITVRNEPYAL